MLVESTLNHLVRFLYKETSTLESFEIEDVLENDCEMREAYQELKSGFFQLPKASFNPKESTIQAILRYSQRTFVEPSH